MAAKMFPHLKLLCWLFMVPTLGFDTKQRNSFCSNLVFFTIKTRFWQYYSLLNMRKSHLNEEFLVLLGPIISRFFLHVQMRKKLTKTTKGACSSPISMGGSNRQWQANTSSWWYIINYSRKKCFNIGPGNTKGGSIIVPLTSWLTGLEPAVWLLTIFVFIWKTD